MSAALMREAAALMRDRAKAALTGHWTAETFMQGHGLVLRDAEHIASWPPAVALAVADWLDKSAETYVRLEDDLRGLAGAPTIEQVYGYDFTEALATASAYLGRTDA